MAVNSAAASNFGLQGLPWNTNPGPSVPDLTRPAPAPLPSPTIPIIPIMPLPDNNGGVDFYFDHGQFRSVIRPNSPGGPRVEGNFQIQLK
ncbi:MAG: hypothetical protein ABJN14_07420 [Paracoccaceae bacterium]